MKKIFIAIIVLIGFCTPGFAQTGAGSLAASPAAKKVVLSPTKATVAPKASAAVAVKNDGSPDMRFKVNKAAAKAASRLKKDGTPDMRYSRNKKQ